MENRDLEALQIRLSAVEQRLRVLVMGWAFSMIFLTVLWIGTHQARSQTQHVQTRGIDIMDEAGRRRIALGFADNGAPGIWILDTSGHQMAELGVGSQGFPAVWFNDGAGKERVVVGFVSGQPGIRVYDAGARVIWAAP